ncbi:MAG: rhomboid family intramembrane serine protease [Woeseiaceae bacterium]|nr:rhomboid family intramembrane serine protease [Woeseiaceae bacterium]
MQPQPYNRQPESSIPNAVFALLIINGLVFAAQQFAPREWFGQASLDLVTVYFGLWPFNNPDWLPQFMPWQLVTYSFLHDTQMLAHIAINMFVLFMLGRDVERFMGTRRFLVYYFTCVVGAGFVQLVVAKITNGNYPTIGASGGVFGILLAYGMMFPNRMILLLIPPIPMKAKYLVVLLGLIEIFLGVSGLATGVAHFAHLGGMFFGFILIRYWSRVRRR